MDYYVDSIGGSNLNLGTLVFPWRTLIKVHDEFARGKFSGGDRILFKRGQTWTATHTARLRVRNVAGTAPDNPLYIGAYGEYDAVPKLDGHNAFGSCILGGYHEVVNHVVVESLEITGTSAQVIFLQGVQGWILRNLKLGHGNVGNALIIRRSTQIVVDECDIAGGSSGKSPVYIGTADDLTDQPSWIYITNCYIHDSGNEVIDLKPGCHHVNIIGNTLTNAAHEVVSIRGGHHLVKDNIISNPTGDYGIAGWEGGYPALAVATVIEGNLIRNISGTGIRLEGSDHTVRNNTIVDCDEGIKVRGSNFTIKNNIFYDASLGIDVGAQYPLPYSDYNCFHSLTNHLYLGGRGNTQSAATACAHHGIECHSIVADPAFIDHTHYHIHTDSPCYHAGQDGATIGYFIPQNGGDIMSVIEDLRAEATSSRAAADRMDAIADALALIDASAQAAVVEAQEALVAAQVVEEAL